MLVPTQLIENKTENWLRFAVRQLKVVHQSFSSDDLAAGPVASGSGVRREKAALSSGCKSHPATAPAGSNRSSHGGNEVAEAFGKRVTKYGDSASV